MAQIQGSIFIVARPEANFGNGAYQYVIQNRGDVTLTATHNVQSRPNEGGFDSDDFESFGHGLRTPPNGVSEQSFPCGHIYKGGTPIQPGAIFRAGARYLFHKEVRLPPMEHGQVIRLEFDSTNRHADDVEWEATGNGFDVSYLENAANHARGYEKPGQHVGIHNAEDLLGELDVLLGRGDDGGPKVQGTARVEPHTDDQGRLTHWTVTFSNDGSPSEEFSPFIGTVAFTEAQNKNAGLGLDAMACPEQGSSAVQRIEANGNYGVLAQPGARIRLGVRGLSTFDTALPPVGERVERPLSFFRKDSSASQPDFFDLENVQNKRAEKMGSIQFFQNGAPLNGEIRPVIFRGDEAVAQSDYAVPELRVRHVENGPHGQAGWELTVRNRLGHRFPEDFPRVYPADFPDQAKRGMPLAGEPIGFMATLKLGGATNRDHMRAKALREAGEERRWFIPEGMVAEAGNARAVAEPGALLTMGTRGMGVYIQVPLPAPGEAVEVTQSSPDAYRLRPDQVSHSNLAHGYFAAHVNVEDPPAASPDDT